MRQLWLLALLATSAVIHGSLPEKITATKVESAFKSKKEVVEAAKKFAEMISRDGDWKVFISCAGALASVLTFGIEFRKLFTGVSFLTSSERIWDCVQCFDSHRTCTAPVLGVVLGAVLDDTKMQIRNTDYVDLLPTPYFSG